VRSLLRPLAVRALDLRPEGSDLRALLPQLRDLLEDPGDALGLWRDLELIGQRLAAERLWIRPWRPTAAAAKRHLWALAKRYARAWGEELIGPWKQEFQARGGPPTSGLSTALPMGFTTITDPHTGRQRKVDFKTWLSST
jgi:hypothetical protein